MSFLPDFAGEPTISSVIAFCIAAIHSLFSSFDSAKKRCVFTGLATKNIFLKSFENTIIKRTEKERTEKKRRKQLTNRNTSRKQML